jgi:hypothetical protein
MKKFTNWFKWSLVPLLLSCVHWSASGQSTANYGFTSNTTGSLTDMSASTTQIHGTGVDASGGEVPAYVAIGFDFYMMGSRYTYFGADANGCIKLSSASGTMAQMGNAPVLRNAK